MGFWTLQVVLAFPRLSAFWGTVHADRPMHALLVAMGAGVAGGLYPAWRATRMRPVEALRFE